MDAPELVRTFALHSGATQLQLNALGVARLRFDDGPVVDLQSRRDGHELLLITVVIDQTADLPPAGLAAALRANYLFEATAGAALSIDPHTGELLLSRAVDCGVATAESLAHSLQGLVRCVQPLARRLLDPQQPSHASPDARHAAALQPVQMLGLRA